MQKSLTVATAGGSQRPSCHHGAKCYRYSSEHKAEYAHVGDEDYQCSERTASSVVDLTGAEDKSPAAATDDARRTASSVVEKIEVTDISGLYLTDCCTYIDEMLKPTFIMGV